MKIFEDATKILYAIDRELDPSRVRSIIFSPGQIEVELFTGRYEEVKEWLQSWDDEDVTCFSLGPEITETKTYRISAML